MKLHTPPKQNSLITAPSRNKKHAASCHATVSTPVHLRESRPSPPTPRLASQDTIYKDLKLLRVYLFRTRTRPPLSHFTTRGGPVSIRLSYQKLPRTNGLWQDRSSDVPHAWQVPAGPHAPPRTESCGTLQGGGIFSPIMVKSFSTSVASSKLALGHGG